MRGTYGGQGKAVAVDPGGFAVFVSIDWGGGKRGCADFLRGAVDRSLTEVSKHGRNQYCPRQREGEREGHENSFHRRDLRCQMTH